MSLITIHHKRKSYPEKDYYGWTKEQVFALLDRVEKETLHWSILYDTEAEALAAKRADEEGQKPREVQEAESDHIDECLGSIGLVLRNAEWLKDNYWTDLPTMNGFLSTLSEDEGNEFLCKLSERAIVEIEWPDPK